MIKLIAFDWNGTLLADAFTIEAADNKILKFYGLPKINMRRFRETFDIPISKYWIALGFGKKHFELHAEEINRMFCEFYEPLANKCRTRSGAREILKYLNNQKIKAIIFSNHTTPDIKRQLKRLRIEDYFHSVIARENNKDSSHMYKRGKDLKLLDYVKQNKLKPHEVITIGDTEEEIEIGKKFGYHTVAITGGYNTTARLKKHHPDFLIHNMKELIPIIKKLNH